ncbi:GNAT family N-acetyltransferase [Pseudoxanthomonas dokdonensis]|uniref:Acetyltransferase n=1 Tax=Pseudoxanthomonas dokdonensis TaxID=344882 RepID=A0A0R0CTN3_9GAMM|nr:GNAT family N-acetyltransferase [Pseudoxanthomonas dokdonensis]KRG69674.1 acetyltransferase [Pseudoxanthomonas dokdonensis]
MPVRLDYLCQRPDLIAGLAQAHVDAFGALLPGWTVEAAAAELATHRQAEAIPTTLVALQDGRWLGSVSLLQNDHEDIRQYSPWLASLVVTPEARGQGIGQQLVHACVALAGRLQVPRLYLYCTDAVAFYQRLGWQVHDHIALASLQVTVMSIQPPAAPPQP